MPLDRRSPEGAPTSTFNGPEFAAEARVRLARADEAASVGYDIEATHNIQAALVLTNLALLAVKVEASEPDRDVPGNRAWRGALGATD